VSLFVDTETISLTELGKLVMHRSQIKTTTYMYTKWECRMMERESKVSPQEGLKATTGVSTAILRKGRLLKPTQLQASGS